MGVTGEEKYRLLLSDGKYSNSFCMLGTHLNERLHNKELETFTILKLTKVICNKSDNPSQTKTVILVFDFEVIYPGDKVGYKIGSPEPMGSDGSVTINQNTYPKAGNAINQIANPNARAELKRPAGPVGGQPLIKTTPATHHPQQKSVLSSRPGVGNTGIFTTVKYNKSNVRRVALSNRNKIEYLHNQLKKIKFKKNALAEELQDKEEELQYKEEEFQTEKEKVNDMKKQVECPVCLDVPRKGPVYACPNGHLVCQKCKRVTCPTCRETMGENKSLLAVRIIEKILHNCRFIECEEEYTLQLIEQHEKMCEHRKVACPNFALCDQMVPLSKLLDHLEINTCRYDGLPTVVGDSPGIRKYHVPISELTQNHISWKVATFLYKGFSLALCVDKSGENWQFTVVMFECPEVCSWYKIEIEVYEADSLPETRLGAKVRCHPCSIDEPIAERKGLGLCVPHRFMERMMLKEDGIKFTVSFNFF